MDLFRWLISAGALSAFSLALAAFIRTRPAMKTAMLKGEDALWHRIEIIEAKAEADRVACEQRVERMQERHTAEIEAIKNEHADSMLLMEAEIRVLRHDRNNLRSGFNAMLAMLKRPDANVPQVIAAVEEMVSKGDEVLAIERAALVRGGK